MQKEGEYTRALSSDKNTNEKQVGDTAVPTPPEKVQYNSKVIFRYVLRPLHMYHRYVYLYDVSLISYFCEGRIQKHSLRDEKQLSHVPGGLL